jgi:hypothetical protein
VAVKLQRAEADASAEAGVLRRAARLHRARPTSKSTNAIVVTPGSRIFRSRSHAGPPVRH